MLDATLAALAEHGCVPAGVRVATEIVRNGQDCGALRSPTNGTLVG